VQVERVVERDPWQAVVVAHGKRPAVRRETAALAMPELPPGPFGATIDELKRRADAGDARAAGALADGYRRCEYFQPPQDQADLEKRAEDRVVFQLDLADQLIGQVKDAAAKQGVELGEIPEVDSVSAYEQQLTAETDLAAACRGVDAIQAADWLSWYGRAAELGDTEAELGYWGSALSRVWLGLLDELPHRKAVAAAALQSSLSRGDWRALAAIGAITEGGYYVEPDPFFAHAYYFAALQGPNDDIAQLPWLDGGGLMRLFSGNDIHSYLAQRMRTTAAALTSAQVAEAERIGAVLYARCCTGRRP
jgi:hypothetical protein